MLLTISTTYRPATDLGYLLHKHPARAQTFTLGFGQAHVFYPEATEERCTAALWVEVDPIALVRGRRGATGPGLLDQYVNDRPYAASSFLSVALADVFRSALAGQSRERAALVEQPLPLEATIAALPCRGGEAFLRRVFAPLGYAVQATGAPLDERFPAWGQSRYYDVTLTTETRVQDLLRHIYVLIPVMDDEKHYWVGDDEVEKLLRHGEGWLAAHPEREAITARYLRHQRRLVNVAVARLVDGEAADPDAAAAAHATEEERLEALLSRGAAAGSENASAAVAVGGAAETGPEHDTIGSLHEQRLAAVVAALREAGARRVLDLGCGEGRLLKLLLADQQFTSIVGMDVSSRALELAAQRLHLDALPPRLRDRISLLQGALTYRDRRLAGYDAAALVEVIEHLEPARLGAFERALFAFARPTTVVLTTPNAEYNVRFPTLPAGKFRHQDHRFEWTRAQFAEWAQGAAARHGYTVRLAPIGLEDPALGAPSQMAVFQRPEATPNG